MEEPISCLPSTGPTRAASLRTGQALTGRVPEAGTPQEVVPLDTMAAQLIGAVEAYYDTHYKMSRQNYVLYVLEKPPGEIFELLSDEGGNAGLLRKIKVARIENDGLPIASILECICERAGEIVNARR